MTLNELIKAKPQWADLPIVVSTESGYHYVGASAMVYDSTDQAERDDKGKATPVLVFSPN